MCVAFQLIGRLEGMQGRWNIGRDGSAHGRVVIISRVEKKPFEMNIQHCCRQDHCGNDPALMPIDLGLGSAKLK
jgi:hypothetical protein